MLSLYLPSKGRVTIASKCCFRPPTVVQFACSVARSELALVLLLVVCTLIDPDRATHTFYEFCQRPTTPRWARTRGFEAYAKIRYRFAQNQLPRLTPEAPSAD